MPKDLWLKARLRERDWDIIAELERRNLKQGELSDMVRDGMRRVLFDQDDDPQRIERLVVEVTDEANARWMPVIKAYLGVLEKQKESGEPDSSE